MYGILIVYGLFSPIKLSTYEKLSKNERENIVQVINIYILL